MLNALFGRSFGYLSVWFFIAHTTFAETDFAPDLWRPDAR